MSTFKELTAKIARGQEFMVIDLEDPYLQTEVTEKCWRYPIIATRVPIQEIAIWSISHPPHFRIDCTGILLDEIIINGPKRQQHLQNLREVFKWLKQAGLHLKPANQSITLAIKLTSKTSIQQKERWRLSRKHQLQEMSRNHGHFWDPSISMSGSFLSNMLAVLICILQASRRKWEWDEAHQQAFQKAKYLLSSQARRQPFKLETEHKPLERIFGEKQDVLKVEYQPGKENQCADTLSWLSMSTTMRSSSKRKFINPVMGGKVEDLTLSTKILQQATAKDPVLSKIKQTSQQCEVWLGSIHSG
ncbi:hypothetical protein J437_LFUL017274 [Ladona fulva]|uniref:Uncharacterized protein n=1 Tax=Ladona fulva TaxID=123851 RepID=A0A8K0P841_LADFU|nr:hypothetical protein J437_LFUL017274 [Ladona fulva]